MTNDLYTQVISNEEINKFKLEVEEGEKVLFDYVNTGKKVYHPER